MPSPDRIPSNYDETVVEAFGDEWARFDQSELSQAELEEAFSGYFGIFPWDRIDAMAEGFDMGCGSGRWAKLVAPRVGKLNCVDASAQVLEIARSNLAACLNCRFHHASLDAAPLEDASQDFGYCLGVLHHVPDTLAGLASCARKLKPGAPFLVYLYYAFDNRPMWFRAVWRLSDLLRRMTSKLPYALRYSVSQLMAFCIYWPLARIAGLAEKLGLSITHFPLAYYRNRSFYTMRTDALDRFGTRLEKRFTKAQTRQMMEDAGFTGLRFSERAPYWCALGYRKESA
jgi:ubiquinone/menaquinone biosynthesis C-methylase UbiE